jgi:hypothetical protein
MSVMAAASVAEQLRHVQLGSGRQMRRGTHRRLRVLSAAPHLRVTRIGNAFRTVAFGAMNGIASP